MSHKFHGRGSGKKKQERRIKKIQDEHVCVWQGVVCCLKGSAVLLSQVNTVMLQLYASEKICHTTYLYNHYLHILSGACL